MTQFDVSAIIKYDFLVLNLSRNGTKFDFLLIFLFIIHFYAFYINKIN